MPCVRLASLLLSRVSRGTRWPELVDPLYSLLLRLQPPVFTRKADLEALKAMERLIVEDRLLELLSLVKRVEGEWRRWRLLDCTILGFGFLALLGVTSLAALLGLLLLPAYASIAAYLLNRSLC